jgi:hypothetical protein
MQRLTGLAAIAVVSAIFLLSALPSFAIEHKYIEDFTTTGYKDTLNTTAWWNTVAGELKLFPLPTLEGTYDTPGYARGVAVLGGYALVADSYSGLQVIDISDPATPVLAGTYNTSGVAHSVTASGDHAFVADYGSGLQVIDISDPVNPTLLGTYNTPGNALGVAVSGDYAFVADGSSGLQVIDISDPVNPTLAGTCAAPGNAYGVAVSGSYAFVADYVSGLQVIDISDPANPTLVGTYDTPGTARGVTVSGDRAFVADGISGLQVIDISNPAQPILAGTYNTPDLAYSVAVSGDRAYVADQTSGLLVIDISDPSTPTLVGTYDTPSAALGVAVSGNHAFVGDNMAGLQVIRISEPVTPTLAGTCNTPGNAWGVAVSGDHAFVADEGSGLQVIDISDPANPTLAGTCDTPGSARDVTISGNHAFVADFGSGLQVIDISDPANPTLVGAYDTPGNAWGVAVAGDRAFVADGGSGLQVIDISDPMNPVLAGTYDTPGWAYSVAVSGDRAFVADEGPGLQVIDISDPANPTLVGTCRLPNNTYSVTVSGDYAYAAVYSSGLQVISISDPANPTLVGSYGTPSWAFGVTISGDHVFMTDYDYGLQVIDVSDPTNPILAGACSTPGYARGVAVSGGYAFVADKASGLQVVRAAQGEVDTDNNVGRSLAVDGSNEMILRARQVTTQTNTVTWELSANGGANWQGIAANGNWNRMTIPGTDLLWRSTHTRAAPGVNPTVTNLEIDWLYEAASIDSIVDVPDDQGGWVLVHITRSGRDFADEATLPISSYGIWRRVDNAVLIAVLETQASPATEKSAAGETRELGDLPVVAYQGKTYVQSRPDLAASSFPPGTWVWAATVPALQKDAYIASVPTVADSSESGPNRTVFVMTAHTTTPSIWYVSEPDSGYSVDNIAPAVPEGFAVAYNTGSGNRLTWAPSPAEDFQYFRIYRSSDPNFVPSSSEFIHSLTATSWSDPDYDGWSVYYKITALDYVGNESGPATPGTVTAVDGPVIPQAYGLYPNAPNPFNPSTSIRYDVPAGGGAVTLRIYDVSGRLIRTLADGPQTAGQKTAVWNGKDDRGRGMASGVYFYRLQAPGYKKTLKMILVQ